MSGYFHYSLPGFVDVVGYKHVFKEIFVVGVSPRTSCQTTNGYLPFATFPYTAQGYWHPTGIFISLHFDNLCSPAFCVKYSIVPAISASIPLTDPFNKSWQTYHAIHSFGKSPC